MKTPILRSFALTGLALLGVFVSLAGAAPARAADDPWLTIKGEKGPGKGKKIVLIAGDQEYRSEEALPQLARILAKRHGFDCTVLFCIDPADGTINPTVNNIPGLDKLKQADLVVIFARYLDLPDDQMKQVLDYVDSGKPILGIRTSTHAFNPTSSAYKKYAWTSKEPGFEGGWGRLVLGETWINHHGTHAKEGTRGVPAPGQEKSPILRGIEPGSIFGQSDVYEVRLPLPGDSTPIVLGQVTATLEPDSAPVAAKNDPMMPIAWTRTYRTSTGKSARVFASTIGAAKDLPFEGTRRLLVNGVYWTLGLENRIPARSNVDLVGAFNPTMFYFKKNEDWKPGVKPSQLAP
jgi:type 1 glutamine amidotransferase